MVNQASQIFVGETVQLKDLITGLSSPRVDQSTTNKEPSVGTHKVEFNFDKFDGENMSSANIKKEDQVSSKR